MFAVISLEFLIPEFPLKINSEEKQGFFTLLLLVKEKKEKKLKTN